MALKRHFTYIIPGLLAASGIALGAQSLAAHPHPKPKKKVVMTAPSVTPETTAPTQAMPPDSTRIIRRMVNPESADAQSGDIEIVEEIEIIDGETGDRDVRIIIVDGQPQLQLPETAEQPEADTMKRRKRYERRSRRAGEDAQTDMGATRSKRVIKKRMRVADSGEPQIDENGMRVIKLTGETIVKVGTNGQLEIYNNGRMIEPMSFAPAEQGDMQTQVEDDGETMNLSVKKTVSEGDQGRKIRVEIDMETAED